MIFGVTLKIIFGHSMAKNRPDYFNDNLMINYDCEWGYHLDVYVCYG